MEYIRVIYNEFNLNDFKYYIHSTCDSTSFWGTTHVIKCISYSCWVNIRFSPRDLKVFETKENTPKCHSKCHVCSLVKGLGVESHMESR